MIANIRKEPEPKKKNHLGINLGAIVSILEEEHRIRDKRMCRTDGKNRAFYKYPCATQTVNTQYTQLWPYILTSLWNKMHYWKVGHKKLAQMKESSICLVYILSHFKLPFT